MQREKVEKHLDLAKKIQRLWRALANVIAIAVGELEAVARYK